MIYGGLNTYSEVPSPLRGIAPDSLAKGQSNNLYGYTMNSPLNYVDLNGEAITVAVVLSGVKVFAGGALIGAGTNVITQVGSDVVAGESFTDSVDNISWGEVGVHAIGSGATTLIPGSNVVTHAFGNLVIQTDTYAGTQRVSGDDITVAGVIFNASTGFACGEGNQLFSNFRNPLSSPELKFGVP